MPSVMTLEGAGRRRFRDLFGLGRTFGDAWSDDQAAAAPPPSPVEAMTTSFVSWGILAFAIVTAAVRGKQAFDRWSHPRR